MLGVCLLPETGDSHPQLNITSPIPDTQYPIPNIRYPISDTQDQHTADTDLDTPSSILHPAPILFPAKG